MSNVNETECTHGVPGEPVSTKHVVLETGAAMTQDFTPVQEVCAHLNAWHVYANDLSRAVETNHYCTHVNEDFRQCLLYDRPGPKARLIGVEYMVTPKLYKELPPEERKYWHSHVFEVKSGMPIMPTPKMMPNSVWEAAETSEMEEVVHLYGKVYHLWQTDRGDQLPLGEPQLMTSFTDASQIPGKDLSKFVEGRDKKFGVDVAAKKEKRAHIPVPEIHPDADSAWLDR